MTPDQSCGSPASLFEFLIREGGHKSLYDLASELECDVGYLYKIRSGKHPMSANLILRIHEHYGMAVQEIRDRSGQRARWLK